MTQPRLRIAAYVIGLLFIVFLALQFAGPKVTNPPVTADLQGPDEVKAVLKTSCYNCHSNETHLWWYDKIAPASWLVARDVKRGRMHMNFSTFAQLSPAQQKGFLYESVNQMQQGYMPPANYLLLHPDAKVTPEQLDTLKKYLHPPTSPAPGPGEARDLEKAREVAALEATQQYAAWIASGSSPRANVPNAPNGLAFFPDYKNWKPVSTTDRFDNGTLRVILGNDIAQKAIASGNVHPWPDGTAFAKIAYKKKAEHPAGVGVLAPAGVDDLLKDEDSYSGAFIQVEFMLKDAAKYKSTEGWGFGRWRGTDLKPYGANANFTTECTSCHRPMEANDFVYTMPIHDAPDEAFNATAALPAGLKHDPLQWRVITSSVDHALGTMSTLYGNDAAVEHARTSPQSPYPAGAKLALVTWHQQEHKHWFGGRIPGKTLTTEYVLFSARPDGTVSPDYLQFEGSKPLTDQLVNPQHIAAITSMRAAVMP